MKINQITNNYIEVTVTEVDLGLFDMNMDSVSADSPNLKAFLFRVMEFVKSETDFDPKKGQVFIEARRTEDKLVFKIKKMGLTRSEKKEKYKNARAVMKKKSESVYIYGFDRFKDMSDALCLVNREMLAACAVYRFMDVYYCVFRTDKPFDGCAALMSEFCSVYDRFEFTDAVLAEHGECIAEGESVVSLVDGIVKYDLG